jgi:hypothetical protein
MAVFSSMAKRVTIFCGKITAKKRVSALILPKKLEIYGKTQNI